MPYSAHAYMHNLRSGTYASGPQWGTYRYVPLYGHEYGQPYCGHL